MAIFKSCCCCFSLRTGCILIGVLEILFTLSSATSLKAQTSIIFSTLIGIITSALLIYGAIKKNRFCLWPWIVANILAIITFIIGLILCVFASRHIVEILEAIRSEGKIDLTDEEAEEMKTAGTVLVVIVAVALIICITILTLLTLVVYSYILELREEEERQHNDTNAPPKAYNLVPV